MNEKSQGDPRIIAELRVVRWRNSNNDNPNLRRPRMVFDFAVGKIRIEAA